MDIGWKKERHLEGGEGEVKLPAHTTTCRASCDHSLGIRWKQKFMYSNAFDCPPIDLLISSLHRFAYFGNLNLLSIQSLHIYLNRRRKWKTKKSHVRYSLWTREHHLEVREREESRRQTTRNDLRKAVTAAAAALYRPHDVRARDNYLAIHLRLIRRLTCSLIDASSILSH